MIKNVRLAESGKKFHILFLQTSYSDTDGSSIALNGLIKDNINIESYKVLSLFVKGNVDINLQTVTTWHQIKEEIDSGNYDIIHYFKTNGYTIFRWTCKALKKSKCKLPIYITVNQRPSYKGLLLSPKEIHAAEKIVFIDSIAYSDKIVSFIPGYRKEKIYYSTSLYLDTLNELYTNRVTEKASAKANSHVVFGRGSTTNKCPPDMYDIFHHIKYNDKEFRVIGISKDSEVYSEGEAYPDVTVYPVLPTVEWYRQLSKFDVFLYQIPESAYSSLDGTLGTAMILGIPVVYYGPDAPKERFIHGINGFVASTKEDIPIYCQMLAEDPILRERIGEAGRKSTLEMFPWQKTVQQYSILWTERYKSRIKVPFKYRYIFYSHSIGRIIREFISWSPFGYILRKFLAQNIKEPFSLK